VFGRCATLIKPGTRWSLFIDELTASNFQIVNLKDTSATCYISIDYDKSSFKTVSSNPNIVQKILIAVEPPSVNPLQFQKRIYSMFDTIIALKTFEHMFPNAEPWLPGFIYNNNVEISEVASENTQMHVFGMLSSNKYSFLKTSLYMKRKEIVKELSRYNHKVLIAGANWNRSKTWKLFEIIKTLMLEIKFISDLNLKYFINFPLLIQSKYQYFGKATTPYSFYSKIHFVICVESDLLDFSEKLFEVIESGAIPLYIGPEIENFGIPSEAFVRMPEDAKIFAKTADLISKNSIFHKRAPRDKENTWLINWGANKSFIDLANICKNMLSTN
jgi:hypothetical protein